MLRRRTQGSRRGLPCPDHLLSFFAGRKKGAQRGRIRHCHTAAAQGPRGLPASVPCLVDKPQFWSRREWVPGTEGGDLCGGSCESLRRKSPPRRCPSRLLCVSPAGFSSLSNHLRVDWDVSGALGTTTLPPFPEAHLLCHTPGRQRAPCSSPGSSTVTRGPQRVAVSASKSFCRLHLGRGVAGPEGTHMLQCQRCSKSSPKGGLCTARGRRPPPHPPKFGAFSVQMGRTLLWPPASVHFPPRPLPTVDTP